MAEESSQPAAVECVDDDVLVSIDVEGGGNLIDCPLVSVGLAILSKYGLVRSRMDIKRQWDEEIDNKLWWEKEKRPDGTPLFDFFQQNAVSEKEALKCINEHITGLQEACQILDSRFVLISDNPRYDIGVLEHAMLKHGLRKYSLAAPDRGVYYGVQDPASEIEHHPLQEELYHRVAEQVSHYEHHRHLPECDATWNLFLYIELHPEYKILLPKPNEPNSSYTI